MNVWLVGATILLLALLPVGWVLMRGDHLEALVAIELFATVVTVVLLLLSEGYHRPTYFTVPLVVAFLNLVGGLIYVRFVVHRRL